MADRKTTPPAERFWKKVHKTDTCWLWTGSANRHGYGSFAVDGRDALRRSENAHRFSWRLHYGDIPAGVDVCHRCDVPRCVRPDHLWLGTRLENMADAKAKGRLHRRGDTCPHGHPFTPENTYINAKGYWFCRECGRQSTRKREAEERRTNPEAVRMRMREKAWRQRQKKLQRQPTNEQPIS